MDITSLGFIIFLLGGGLVYYCIPVKSRWKILVLLSFIFVLSASLFGIAFILITSGAVYICARKISTTHNDGQKRKYLLYAIILSVSILIILKYIFGMSCFTQWRIDWLDGSASVHYIVRKYMIPIGMSYYTLQVISYLLDVYWGRMEAEQNYFKILLFTCYFPQLVQGPISKYSELAPELFKEHKFEWKNIKYGVQLMLWGFFKKMFIADRIGVYVNEIFHEGITPYGLTAWMGLVFYGIQLYCDFSGGIDVIRGVSECFGIGMKDNFRQPYFSLSLGEFWRRWHISLGEWMKDYIFYPVSISKWMGNVKKYLKKITSRKAANRIGMAISDLIVFGLVGIWHGLGTNYLAWGLYNGIILAISAVLVDDYAKWKNKLKVDHNSRSWRTFCLIRTLVIVTVGWIFDCTYTAGAAGQLFIHLFEFGKTDFSVLSVNITDIIILVFGCLLLLVVDILHEKKSSIRQIVGTKNYWIQVAFWTIMIQLIACFGRVASAGGFMYANF